jgi:hypothetical protein
MDDESNFDCENSPLYLEGDVVYVTVYIRSGRSTCKIVQTQIAFDVGGRKRQKLLTLALAIITKKQPFITRTYRCS